MCNCDILICASAWRIREWSCVGTMMDTNVVYFGRSRMSGVVDEILRLGS